MRSVRVLLEEASVGATALVLQQGHLHVVVREGDEVPRPSDWELLVVTDDVADVRPGAHVVSLRTVDGHHLRGRALVRFSDGRSHLLRGDGALDGVAGVL